MALAIKVLSPRETKTFLLSACSNAFQCRVLANILIAALLSSLEESPAERLAFPPKGSNGMYRMHNLAKVEERMVSSLIPRIAALL